ncbi:MAG: TIGR02281 family clan AA aspartic protease [Rhodobacteraceae bacterium]|nr:TIGR02281 family clan AA aspartic protease [Paracoccaceae bacterium]
MRDLTADNQATLAYLVLLLVVVGGSMVIGSRAALNRHLQQLGIWTLIFIGMIGAYSMRDQIEAQIFPSRPQIGNNGTVSISRAWDGHFYVDVTINGNIIEFVVDTGATNIVLTQDDAEKIGFHLNLLNYTREASTANGVVATAPVRLQTVVLGPFNDRNLRAMVNGGELRTSLLGMEYLSRFVKIEITSNQMLLIR